MKQIYCPICHNKIDFASYYLFEQFDNFNDYQAAALVTHYRHEHIDYYDNNVGYVSKFYSYYKFKAKVNNRAKRQLIRAFMKDNSLNFDTKKQFINSFLNLQYNDDKTKEMILKFTQEPKYTQNTKIDDYVN